MLNKLAGGDQISIEDIEKFLQTVQVLEDEIDHELLMDKDQEDLHDYWRFHARRLWRSLHILFQYLPAERPIRILELGAMPYYFTALMLSYFNDAEIVGANTEGKIIQVAYLSEAPARKVKLHFGNPAQEREVEVHVMNLELDPFPFPDASFDVVICMEVIEHLIYSPTHMLAESHRVLAPGGLFLLTTPNAVDMKRTLSLLLNRSTSFPYSGYSIYGRHNREFIRSELVGLTQACGFNVINCFMENIHHRKHYAFAKRAGFRMVNLLSELPFSYFRNKKEYVFLIAQSTGEVRWEYPLDLYLFRHLYPRRHSPERPT